MNKIWIFPAVTILALLLHGCGYSCGPLGHPQLQSVAVAPVINETLSYNAAAQLRGMLSECFTTDGTMKLESQRKADCIVYATVTDVKITELDWSDGDDDDFQANEWKCAVTVKYSVILPGRGKPLISNASASGDSEFATGPDMEGSRSNGVRQAMFDAAKKIVANVTEAW